MMQRWNSSVSSLWLYSATGCHQTLSSKFHLTAPIDTDQWQKTQPEQEYLQCRIFDVRQLESPRRRPYWLWLCAEQLINNCPTWKGKQQVLAGCTAYLCMYLPVYIKVFSNTGERQWLSIRAFVRERERSQSVYPLDRVISAAQSIWCSV